MKFQLSFTELKITSGKLNHFFTKGSPVNSIVTVHLLFVTTSRWIAQYLNKDSMMATEKINETRSIRALLVTCIGAGQPPNFRL